MATGDLKQNLARLKQAARSVKYDGQYDEAAIGRGSPEAILPLISHAFFHYSRHLANFLADKGYNAAAKNDVRMIEGVFKVLREEFRYRPTLKISQFFGGGFVECKIIFVCDIIRICRQQHSALWKTHKDARAKVALGKYQPNARLQGQRIGHSGSGGGSGTCGIIVAPLP